MRKAKEGKAAAREQFRQLPFHKKAQHIYIYYKWPIILTVIALIILGSAMSRFLNQKERVLYLGFANVSMGAEMEEALSTGYLTDRGLDPKKTEIMLYRDFYLAEEAEGEAHKSVYATRVKLLASVESQQLDALLMSRQAYDIISGRGFLMDLTELLSGDPALMEATEPLLTQNAVLTEDNDIAWRLGEADEHVTKSVSVTNGLRVTDLPCFASSGFSDQLYLGFIANTPRASVCRDYLDYLLSE